MARGLRKILGAGIACLTIASFYVALRWHFRPAEPLVLPNIIQRDPTVSAPTTPASKVEAVAPERLTLPMPKPDNSNNNNNNNNPPQNPPAQPSQQQQQQQQQTQPQPPQQQQQQQQQQQPQQPQQAPAGGDLPQPIVRPLHQWVDDGNRQCFNNRRDFEKRPVVIFSSGASPVMQLPPLDMCDVPCFITGDGSMRNRADVFPGWESAPGTAGCEHQKSAWITMENYEHRSAPSGVYQMTVSLSSDVPVPYLSWFDFEPMRPGTLDKTGDAMATAFISNCGAADRRAFVEALMAEGITVHSFGGCLHNKDEASVSNLAGKYERKMDIMSKYKFHLAFENSRTRDYVTEKFFQTLEAGTIPVYFGAPNIADFEPSPGSVLRVADYGSATEVAKAMKELAANPEAYKKMLEWKIKGPSPEFRALFDLNVIHSQCRLCLKTADDYAIKYGDLFDGVAPEHRSVARTDFHVLVRERNTYYFYVVPLQTKTMAGLREAVLRTFKGYVPLFARHQKLVDLRKYTGKFYIHRIYPAYLNVHDTLYGDQAFKADDAVAGLASGAKLETIFLEDN